MNVGLIIALAGGALVVAAYAILEIRINQKACAECGFRVSRDSLEAHCPRCRTLFENASLESGSSKEGAGTASAYPVPNSNRRFNWPKLVLIAIPICVAVVDGAIIVGEQLEPGAEKAIRLVKESNSRKENFTVQQYLYATVYHRKNQGEPIEIQGWSARYEPAENSIKVEFNYKSTGKEESAVWDVKLPTKTVVPVNDLARELSWTY